MLEVFTDEVRLKRKVSLERSGLEKESISLYGRYAPPAVWKRVSRAAASAVRYIRVY
jgi:hypothetical protein